MKRKIFRVLFALVLVVSFSLVTATPAAAAATTYNVAEYTLASASDATPAWSTTQQNTGTHSVKLIHSAGASARAYVQFTPPTGITLAEFVAAPATYGFSYWRTEDKIGPQLELTFTDGSDGWVELTAEVALYDYTTDDLTGEWIDKLLSGTEQCQFFGEDSNNAALTPPGLIDLSTLVTAIATAATADSAAAVGAWTMTKVIVDLGWSADTQTAYVDDIIIDGTTYYGLFEDVIDVAAATGDTISVAAGTYDAETTWPIDVDKALTIQGADGKTSIINPGSAGQGVIAISADNVTLDGFTITHGTQTSSASNPVENTVWVAAEYSTIKNNTITGAGGTASIYIGGRTDPDDVYAQWLYGTGEPLGHVIQDNVINHRNSGEGWGIFAVELTDSLIHGNSFTGSSDVGDARATAWNTTVGTPGTCIIIHSATFDDATGAPGGGYVVVEDNTASWVKYTFMNFVAGVMVADVDGVFYEKAVAGTVDGVIVRDNTATNIGKNSTDYSSGNIVNFSAESKAYTPTTYGASLTIGANKVTIGPGNTFQTADSIINIKNPKTALGTKYGVLTANNIVVIHSNLVSAESYGIYNGTTHSDQDLNSLGGDAVIVALNNWWGNTSGPADAVAYGNTGYTAYGGNVTASVTYEPWLLAAAVTDVTPTTYEKTLALKDDFTLVSSDKEVTTGNWTGTTVLSGTDTILAYKYDADPSSDDYGYTVVTLVTQLTSVDAYYIKTDGGGGVGINYSTSAPGVVTKTLSAGWNIISCASSELDSYNVITQLRYAQIGEQEGAGVTYLIGQGTYNQLTNAFSYPTATTGDWTTFDSANENLSEYDGYWVYMNAAKSFGVIPD